MALRRCYGCMSMIEEAVCPHCGYSISQNNDANQLPVGTLLKNQYLIGKVLGHGGFGITYIGWDIYLDMAVAIKEFYPASAVNRDVSQSLTVRVNLMDAAQHYEQSRERFLREAKTLAKLSSVPEIVGIQGYFTDNNTAYIIMEYVRGVDLRHYVQQRGGRIGSAELLSLMEPVIRALHNVHEEGLVHRDISPDNIMIQPNGRAKLLDFGAVRDAGDSDADIDLSHSTEAILKHGFAPMEQYRSRGNLGPWTDEYGFCASIYYCLTGKVPPDAPSRAMEDAQPEWDRAKDLTPMQRYALEKGMSMRAKDRFGSMEALRAALYDQKDAPVNYTRDPSYEREFAEDETRTVRKSRGWIAAVLVFVLLAAAGAGLYFARDQVSELLKQFGYGAEESLPAEMEAPVPVQTTGLDMEETEPQTFPSEETEPAPQETEDVSGVSSEIPEPWVENVMVSRPLSRLKAELANVTTVTFRDTLVDVPANPIDVSASGDGSVLAWGEWKNGYQVVIAAEGGINGRDSCAGLFQGCPNLQSVSFGTAFHSDYATSMESMFAGCYILNSVDLDALDTRNVTNMRYMFAIRDPSSGKFRSERWDANEDLSIPTLDLRSFDTRNVQDMSYMFYGRHNMTTLYVDTWDTSKVTNMSYMFYRCSLLPRIDVSGWDVGSVQNFTYTFGYCERLSDLDVSGWNVGSATTMNAVFYYCNSLSSLDVSGWDVSRVRNMESMFSFCSTLEYVDVSRWDVSNVSNVTDMFRSCLALEEPEVDNWDISNVTSYSGFLDGGSLINERYWTYFFRDIGT